MYFAAFENEMFGMRQFEEFNIDVKSINILNTHIIRFIRRPFTI